MSAQPNNKIIEVCCFLATTAGAILIGAGIGLAFDRFATLPDLERFWIGTGIAAAFGLWLCAIMMRAWLETRR